MKFRIWNNASKCYVHEMGDNQRTLSEFYLGGDGNIIELITSHCESDNQRPSIEVNYDTQFFDTRKKELISKYRIERQLEIKDSQGKELYEGDMVRAWFPLLNRELKGVITYYPHNEAFRLHTKYGSHYSFLKLCNIEKIGNIHKDLK